MILKLLKTSYKDKIFKANRKKNTYKEKKIRLTVTNYSSETIQARKKMEHHLESIKEGKKL